MPDDPGPLQEKDLEDIKHQLEKLAQAEEVIRRAKAAGMDFSEQEKQARELRKQITNIRNSFFPGRT